MYIRVLKGKNSGKKKFNFCPCGSSPSKVYKSAVLCIFRGRTNPWVLPFDSYSVAKQQVNRIVSDMCVRWQ
jgi:hypothetical protein